MRNLFVSDSDDEIVFDDKIIFFAFIEIDFEAVFFIEIFHDIKLDEFIDVVDIENVFI